MVWIPNMRGFLVLSDENSKYKRAHGPIWLKLQMHECFLTPESWSLVHRERISSVESGKVPVSCLQESWTFQAWLSWLSHKNHNFYFTKSLKKKSNIGTSLVAQWLRLHFCCRGLRLDWETKIPHAAQQKKKKKSQRKYFERHSDASCEFSPKSWDFAAFTLLLLSSVTFLKSSSGQHEEKFWIHLFQVTVVTLNECFRSLNPNFYIR